MFNTHYQPHYHPTTKSLWLCSSVYCRPPHQSRRIWLVAAATNQKNRVFNPSIESNTKETRCHTCSMNEHARICSIYLEASILIWINNYTRYKMWEEIIYPLSNVNGSTVEVWTRHRIINSHNLKGNVITYPCQDYNWSNFKHTADKFLIFFLNQQWN